MPKKFENGNFGFFVIFGVNLRDFSSRKKTAIISSKKPTGQRICDFPNVFNILIYDIYQKIDKNALKRHNGRFAKFLVFGVILGSLGSTKKVQKSPQIHIARS